MDINEVEETFFAPTDFKLHGEMCQVLSSMYCKVFGIFPVIEAARPRSTSGIQALCSLHLALERAKSTLKHCSECSKLYLAITGDSVLSKFEKSRYALEDSLRRVEDIVPPSIGCQLLEIVRELEGITFALDPSEKQIGDEIISMLQQGRKFDSSSDDMNEIELFHQAASKLGITSSRAALNERRALKRLLDRARMEDDKRKESIVAYLLHLMRKYSKLFRSDLSDDNDSAGSTPRSPTIQGVFEDGVCARYNGSTFDRQLSKLSSFNFKPSVRRSGQMPVPPEELRCPISLQLMYDPVIVSSGQTYERVCIEKWFSDGHNTCPKTQQQLIHLSLTPNYCVKGLIASWCEQNGIPVPDHPPDSLDLNYWRLAESDSANSKLVYNNGTLKGIKVVPLAESCISEETEKSEMESVSVQEEDTDNDTNIFERYEKFLTILSEGGDLREQCEVVEKIRHLLKEDEEARMFMGANGFVEALMQFLESAVHAKNEVAQEIGAMALFNLGVNNNRNKEMVLASGVIPLLERMIKNSNSYGSAVAVYLNLSCLEEAKPVIVSSNAIPFMIQLLGLETDPQCKLDALHTLFNLSTNPSCIHRLLSSGIVNGLCSLLGDDGENSWTEKIIAVLINLAVNRSGRDEMTSNLNLIGALSGVLDTGEAVEQEQAAACLLILCNSNSKCIQMVLQEGVIPSLVSISVNGTNRGREKAKKLLMLFREQRQREPSPVVSLPQPESIDMPKPVVESEPNLRCKTGSRRKMGKTFGFLWKSKSVAYH
uniref:RING-type E3 ubiquitin transferase n=1 Tax=Kalanchoe fedtschenkoi TaxID=63787 RepID=A0A7N0UWP8_KALFE